MVRRGDGGGKVIGRAARRRLWSVAFWLLAGPAGAESLWEANAWTAIPAGAFVQVREWGLAGTRLDLHRDLGVGSAPALEGTLIWPDAAGSWRAGLRWIVPLGQSTLPADATFNGSTLAGGTGLSTRPWFLECEGSRELTARLGTVEVSGRVGARFTYLDFILHGTLAGDTVGRETREDFYAQELPYPIAGGRTVWPLSPDLAIRLDAAGGGWPTHSSLRNEGGLVRLDQTWLEVQAGLCWTLDAGTRLVFAYRLEDLRESETSDEDGNAIRWRAHGPVLGLTGAL